MRIRRWMVEQFRYTDENCEATVLFVRRNRQAATDHLAQKLLRLTLFESPLTGSGQSLS